MHVPCDSSNQPLSWLPEHFRQLNPEGEIVPNYNRTAHYVNAEKIRADFAEEMKIRGCSFAEVGEQTGILPVGLGRFARGGTLHADAYVTLIKWFGGSVDRYVGRRKSMIRHTDTYEQRQLRNGSAFLNNHLGVKPQEGESAVDAMMRLLAQAKEKGLLND